MTDVDTTALSIRELPGVAIDSFLDDVRKGFSQSPKTLPPKYFYDALGSVLFEAICLLPEYSVTRDETAILDQHVEEIVKHVAPLGCIVELGSGSAVKTTRIIREVLDRQDELEYIPIDVSRSALEHSSKAMIERFPRLRVRALHAGYSQALETLRVERSGDPCMVMFLGSSLGNLGAGEASELLRAVRNLMGDSGHMLLGCDLVKPTSTLISAYDDALGVTAAFNLNILKRINLELDGHFVLENFRHRARYDAAARRVEMHLESLVDQDVRIGALGTAVHFDAGETIWTESSHKYDDASLGELMSSASLRCERYWEDEGGRFRCSLLTTPRA